jgi:hypothetical protein
MKNARRVFLVSLPATASLLAWLLLHPTLTAAQSAPGPFVQVRGAWATHVAGLVVRGSEPAFDYQHRLKSTPGFGLGAGFPLGPGTFGLRLDFDALPRAELRQGNGPPLLNGESGPLWWFAASLAVRPAPLCGFVCVGGAAGAGVGHYPFEYDELRGDIVDRFIRPQTRPAVRFGLELSAPRWVPGLVLYASDYMSVLRGTGFARRSITPIHLLMAGVAFAWSP